MQKGETLIFHKYQGTGNDFIIIDNREELFNKNDSTFISFLCDRRFGVGADGLILLENDTMADFRMVYYNADGNESSMCGNGGRCIVAFANKLGIIKTKTKFLAVDGYHEATIDGEMVSITMKNVEEIRTKPAYFFLNTGSPHHVQIVQDVTSCNIQQEGARLRYGLYGEKGSNINFVEKLSDDTFKIRTYERGVEDETLSCGTGVTAVAIAMHHSKKTEHSEVIIETEGGNLSVSFDATEAGYTNVCLKGPAKFVFKAEIVC